MHVLPRSIMRAAMTAGCTAVLGLSALAATSVSAQAQPAGRSLPFSSCAYGVPKHTPFVVLLSPPSATASGVSGFEATGPYDLVARGIKGPFLSLHNYSNCRVWLHQGSNPFGHGWSICFNPYRFRSSTAVPRKYDEAGSMVISGNTAAC
jgi:hypothetical protein